MEQSNHQSLTTPVAQGTPVSESCTEKTAAQIYRAPALFVIGRAVDLLQGSGGAYWDSDGSYSQNSPY